MAIGGGETGWGGGAGGKSQSRAWGTCAHPAGICVQAQRSRHNAAPAQGRHQETPVLLKASLKLCQDAEVPEERPQIKLIRHVPRTPLSSLGRQGPPHSDRHKSPGPRRAEEPHPRRGETSPQQARFIVRVVQTQPAAIPPPPPRPRMASARSPTYPLPGLHWDKEVRRATREAREQPPPAGSETDVAGGGQLQP